MSSSGSGKKKPKKPERTYEDLMTPIVKKPDLPEISIGELKKSCSDDNNLWIGCKGYIFDVGATEDGREFYGNDGSYNMFVGVDCSMALGKMKFDSEFLDPLQMHWSRDLELRELNILQDWVDKFEGKYPIAGYIKDDGGKKPEVDDDNEEIKSELEKATAQTSS